MHFSSWCTSDPCETKNYHCSVFSGLEEGTTCGRPVLPACTPQHLSLVANIWIVYRGTDLVVGSIMRQYNIPDLLRYPIIGSFPSSWCSPSAFLSDHCGSPIPLSFPFGVARLSFDLLVASNPSLQS